jgi:D-alanine transfer protein
MPHVLAVLAAAAVTCAALTAVTWYAGRRIDREIYPLAGSRYSQKNLGLIVQRTAINRHEDLLPLFGSSEIETESAFHARHLFADAPTGFSVLTVAGPGEPILETVENIGALGDALRGRKVAVSLSPGMFLLSGVDASDADVPTATADVVAKRYAGNFSPLHALSLMLNPHLSDGLKQALARRLLEHPATLARSSVLDVLVRAMADSSLANTIRYYAVLPIAYLQKQFLELEDDVLVLGHLIGPPSAPPAQVRSPRTLNWPALVDEATAQFRARSTNPWTVDDGWWANNREWADEQAGSSSDERFLKSLKESDSWTDLEQLLQVCRELGAQVLLLSMPYEGPLFDHMGVSVNARREYYRRVRAVADRYGASTAVLDDHEYDPYFFFDLWSHLSPKGWIYYDRAIDAFYHDALE